MTILMTSDMPGVTTEGNEAKAGALGPKLAATPGFIATSRARFPAASGSPSCGRRRLRTASGTRPMLPPTCLPTHLRPASPCRRSRARSNAPDGRLRVGRAHKRTCPSCRRGHRCDQRGCFGSSSANGSPWSLQPGLTGCSRCPSGHNATRSAVVDVRSDCAVRSGERGDDANACGSSN